MLYIDCREGVSSDMLLAAMLDLVDDDRRREIVRGLVRGASEHGIRMSVVEVEDGGDRGLGISYSPSGADHDTSYEDAVARLRSMSGSIGSDSPVPLRILDEIAGAEAAVHQVGKAELHLHEVARPEALMNIAGIVLLHTELTREGGDEFVCSTITTGKGIAVVGHGAIRLPAPATKRLLEGMRHEEGDDPGERATPTGVAAVRAIAVMQSDEVPAAFAHSGTGFGTRRFGGRLGRVRLLRV